MTESSWWHIIFNSRVSCRVKLSFWVDYSSFEEMGKKRLKKFLQFRRRGILLNSSLLFAPSVILAQNMQILSSSQEDWHQEMPRHASQDFKLNNKTNLSQYSSGLPAMMRKFVRISWIQKFYKEQKWKKSNGKTD